MSLLKIPKKPFSGYKWKWASVQCTESLNDPIVFHGVLSGMAKLEGKGLSYSSNEFRYELVRLENDLKDTPVSVNLSGRGGDRNLIRNSGQYWKAMGLIPKDSRGVIELTDYGRQVASGGVSQSEFSAITIRTFKLPNPYISSAHEVEEWLAAKLEIFPLLLILQIVRALNETEGEGRITTDELARVVVPLAGESNHELEEFVSAIQSYREDATQFEKWPNCTPGANDMRMLREYLLFLEHYGYLIMDASASCTRFQTPFFYNQVIDEEIEDILSDAFVEKGKEELLRAIRDDRIASGMEAKRLAVANGRPEQAKFRRQILDLYGRCVITNARMPEILQAAHIKPHKYNGPEAIDNGFAMRMDIHRLYDTNHLKIHPDGKVEVSDRARLDYGMTIPPMIVIPETANREYLRWRIDNYVGLC